MGGPSDAALKDFSEGHVERYFSSGNATVYSDTPEENPRSQGIASRRLSCRIAPELYVADYPLCSGFLWNSFGLPFPPLVF